MTEKRFNFAGGYLYDGDEPVGHIEDIRFRQDFLDLLNALHEENERLKQDVDYFNRTYEVQERGLNIVPAMCTISSPTSRRELFKENEQLKQENKKLKEDLEHCANQFTNDGKNVLLSLR